ncbi:MAG: hypothetical protein AAGA02_06015 [Bacteroidota bacterium]
MRPCIIVITLVEKRMTDEQWIVLARHFTDDELKENKKKTLNAILGNKSNCSLIDSIDKIFTSSSLNDFNVEDSLRRLTLRIGNV